MITLDATIVNVALSAIGSDLGGAPSNRIRRHGPMRQALRGDKWFGDF